MFGLTIASVIALAAVQTAAANDSRTELRSCLKEAVEQAKMDKITPDAFPAFANGRCGKAADGLKSALVSFDVKNKVPRRRAESDAQLQIDEFVTMAAEKYTAALPK